MTAATVRLPLAESPATADVVTAVLSIAGRADPDRDAASTACFARRGRDARPGGRARRSAPETDTRLRFVRRLIYAAILLLGVAIALSQFAGIAKLAASLLASGAIAAAIIGFAARQVLANFVAGIMLAITQPLRVGDWVTFEEQLRRGRGRAAQLHGPAHAAPTSAW